MRNVAVMLLLLVLGAELIFSVRRLSQTVDESVHLYAGFQYWKRGDFGVNPEHPPLVKLAAAAALVPTAAESPQPESGATKASGTRAAIPFLYRNAVPWEELLFRGRLGASIFAYLGALTLFLMGREMFGFGVGILALTLFGFEPNLLAHGSLVTTDMGLTASILLTVYGFYRYVKAPSLARLLLSGVAVALALTTKHSGLVVIGLLPLLATWELGGCMRNRDWRRAAKLLGAVVLVLLIGYLGLWAAYGFDYDARPGDLALSPTLEAYASDLGVGLDSRLIQLAAKWRLLPESYLWGLVDVRIATGGRVTYLLGKVYETGQWFYFPVALVVKSTLPMLLLLALLPFAICRGVARELWFVTVPAALFLGSGIASGLNIGLRHVLPIFPFLLLLAGFSAYRLAARGRMFACCAGILFLFHAGSSLAAFPNYLTYSNEAFGGPGQTHRYLSNADADWGESLIQIREYLAANKQTPCWFAYRAAALDLGYFQIPCVILQNGLRGTEVSPFPPTVEGTLLVSTNEIAGQAWGPGELNPYAAYGRRTPDVLIANSVAVFHGKHDISLASALNHARRSFRALGQNRIEAALADGGIGAELAPNNAEARAALCLALLTAQRNAEAEPHCKAALMIADRVYPQYQYLRIPAIRTLAQRLSHPPPSAQ